MKEKRPAQPKRTSWVCIQSIICDHGFESISRFSRRWLGSFLFLWLNRGPHPQP
jgi:hypothetical protein